RRSCPAGRWRERSSCAGRLTGDARDKPRRNDVASSSSFDVTTGVDFNEVLNAGTQATKEITQRYDFKGLKVSIELDQKEKKIVLAAPDDFKVKAVWDVLQSKLVRRQVPLKNLTPGSLEPAAGGTARQTIAIQD